MAQQFLDKPEIGTLFEKVSCKAVAQGVNSSFLEDSSFEACMVINQLNGTPRYSFTGKLAFKKPDVACIVLYEPGDERFKNRIEHYCAILFALALANHNYISIQIHIARLQI
jgi:hypothetical protein